MASPRLPAPPHLDGPQQVLKKTRAHRPSALSQVWWSLWELDPPWPGCSWNCCRILQYQTIPARWLGNSYYHLTLCVHSSNLPHSQESWAPWFEYPHLGWAYRLHSTLAYRLYCWFWCLGQMSPGRSRFYLSALLLPTPTIATPYSKRGHKWSPVIFYYWSLARVPSLQESKQPATTSSSTLLLVTFYASLLWASRWSPQALQLVLKTASYSLAILESLCLAVAWCLLSSS